MNDDVTEHKKYYYTYEEVPAGADADVSTFDPEYTAALSDEPIFTYGSDVSAFSRSQTLKAVIFGVIMPIICFAFDPIVFRGDIDELVMLSAIKGFAYTHAAITISATIMWLVARDRFGGANAAFAGIFGISSVVSLAIGIALLPYSLMGMLIVIGFLGFTPLVSAAVMFGMSRHAYRLSTPHMERPAVINLFMWSALSVFVVSMLMNG